MVRALLLAALVCVCCSLLLSGVEARWTIRPRPTKTTTTISTTTPKAIKTTSKPRPRPTTTTTIAPISVDLIVDDDEDEDDKSWHPIDDNKPRLIDQFDSRSLDGHYEYRYALSNGDTRYERAYWLPVGHTKVLARKGYYSYPLPNHQFMTVFYTADHQGYHQDSSTFSKHQPTLPRSLDVPEHEPPKVNEQHHKHPRKPNKGHGRKPTQPATKTVSHSDSVVEKDEILQDAVAAVNSNDDIVSTTTTKTTPKLRSQHANVVTEFVPTTTDLSMVGGVVKVEEQQQLQELQEAVEEILQEAVAATTLAAEHQQDVTMAAAANWEPEDDVEM